MQLQRAHLVEVCQFRNLIVDFSPGVTGLIGANGAGKSNLMKMIAGAIIGDFSDNAGNKDENINRLAGARAHSYIELQFRHNGHQLDLLRSLRGPKTTLIVDGGETITGETAVNAKLAELLGVGLKVLRQYVFIQQDAIPALFAQTSTERATFFQTMTDTKPAAVLHDVLSKRIATFRPTDYQPSLDAALLAQSQLQAQLNETTARLQTNQAAATADAAQLAAWQQQVSNYPTANAAKDQAAFEEQALQELQTARSQVPNLAEQEGALSQAEGLQQTYEHGAMQDAQDLTAYQVRRQADGVLNSTRQALSVLGAPVRPAILNTPPLPEVELTRLTLTLSDLTTQISERKQFLHDLANGVAACPTCKTPVAQLQTLVDRYKQELPGLEQQQQETHLACSQEKAYAQQFAAATQQYDGAVSRYNLEKTSLESRLAATESSLPTLPATSEADLLTRQQTLQTLRTKTSQLRSQLEQVRSRIQQLDQSITWKQQRLAELRATATTALTPDEYHRITSAIAQAQQLQTAIASDLGLKNAIEVQLQARQQEITNLQLLQAQQAHRQSFYDVLGLTRDLFHRNALPRVVAATFLEDLQDVVNASLQDFEADYTVRVAEDLTFIADFRQGYSQAAARLSGGQKAILALAFLTAVNATFAGELGLFCPDEPTAALDEHNIGCMEVAVNRLRAIASARGVQIIIITHERRLARLFDSVISL